MPARERCGANTSVVIGSVTNLGDAANVEGGAPRLVLASGSPRRHELLSALGATFTIIVTEAERSDQSPPPVIWGALPEAAVAQQDHPTLLAWRKAQAAAEVAPDAIVLGADTVVVVEGDVLNKPADEADARAMLRRLSGRAHTVYTGVCLIKAIGEGSDRRGFPDGNEAPLVYGTTAVWLAVVAAEVEFYALAEAEIAAYVATGEPLDKAGAYGLQGGGGRMVREVRGSYTTVVGFPLVMIHRLLTTAGISGLADPTDTYRRWLQSQGKEPLPWPPTLP